MKNLIITAILLLQVTVFYGKTAPNARLEANVIDGYSGYAMNYVAITILDSDQQYVKGFLSTSNGYFSIDGLPNGRYFVKISKTGYEDAVIPVEITDNSANVMMGPLTMLPQTSCDVKNEKIYPAK